MGCANPIYQEREKTSIALVGFRINKTGSDIDFYKRRIFRAGKVF